MMLRNSSLCEMSTIFINGFVLFSPVFFLKIFIKHSFCWSYSSLSHKLYLLRSMLSDWICFRSLTASFSILLEGLEGRTFTYFYIFSCTQSNSGLTSSGNYENFFWIGNGTFEVIFLLGTLSLKNCLSLIEGATSFGVAYWLFEFKVNSLFVIEIYFNG